MRVVKNSDNRYVICTAGQSVPAVEVFRNPFHDQHVYVKLLTDDFSLLEASNILPEIRSAEGKPLQIMVSSKECSLIRLLQKNGFERKRRCYEMKVRESDSRAKLRRTNRVQEGGPGARRYEECCCLLHRYYRETHESVSPLTAPYEDFRQRLPERVLFQCDGDAVSCAAFVDGNELAYVCAENRTEFSVFIEEVLTRMFDAYPELWFEADDADWAASALKDLFSREAEKCYDTYVLTTRGYSPIGGGGGPAVHL